MTRFWTFIDRLAARRASPLATAASILAACIAMAVITPAHADAYPTMAPLSQYLMDRDAEIAMARSAAPPSVSDDAEVLVLTPKGYVSTGPGKNGFTCMVGRQWSAGVKDPEFWNPKGRGPVCFNREAARSVLPMFLTRTQWVLAGATQAEIAKRTIAAIAAHRIPAPESGAMTFMLSKQGYLGDAAGGPWHPHVMFYTPPIPGADWGAGMKGTHIGATEAEKGVDPYSIFYVLMPNWSDGTPDAAAPGSEHHAM